MNGGPILERDMPRWRGRRYGIVALLFAVTFATGSPAAEPIPGTPEQQTPRQSAPRTAKEPQLPPRLRELGLEQLMNIEVTTVTRRESTVGESAAAVYVITQEDIRRSGATTIPELFRRVPGMDVARIDNDKWAISSRGFNDRYADLLLVQVDGRTVYNPLFAGVYWDSVVYPLEDIERIEVIRGPGASAWGANAVNGVINIITKSAKDTQGGLLSAGAGNMERGFGTVRYGGKLGNNAWFRMHGEGFDRLREQFSEGPINDKWYIGDAGARLDWKPDRNNAFFFDTQYLHSRTGESDIYPQLTPPFAFRDLEHNIYDAGYLLGRWTHTVSKDSRITLQAYWDHFVQRVEVLQQRLRWDTYNLDFQHELLLGERQKLVYGFGYRLVDAFLSKSESDNGFVFTWTRPRRDLQLFSAFVQDQIDIVKNKFSVLLGTKLEHNDFTGFEIQPTARLLWTPTSRQSAWLSVSRAVRTPSLVEDEVLLTLAPAATAPVPTFPRLTFNTGFKSEEVLAYELGYREQPSEEVSVDLAVFYNDYRRLRMGALDAPIPGPDGSLIVPLIFENRMRGETYGAELAADWRPTKWWRLYGTYTFLKMRLHADRALSENVITAAESSQGHSPQHQVYLQSSWDPGRNVEIDLIGRYVSRLTGLNPDNVPGFPSVINSYIAMDARLAWRPRKNLELSVVGQNLSDNHHPEFSSSPQGPLFRNPLAEIRRSVYGRVKWNF
ncbi:MAG TPA: TonB-dependent receptor [Dissulfurispiraceae bacterium]